MTHREDLATQLEGTGLSRDFVESMIDMVIGEAAVDIREAVAKDVNAIADRQQAELRARIAELERQLGILHEPDGREARLGVTASAVELLRKLASTEPPSVLADGLREALRFYDLTRKAWLGTRDEFDEVHAELERRTAWSNAQIAKLTEAIRQAAELIEERGRHTGYSLEEVAWFNHATVVATRKVSADDEWRDVDPARKGEGDVLSDGTWLRTPEEEREPCTHGPMRPGRKCPKCGEIGKRKGEG